MRSGHAGVALDLVEGVFEERIVQVLDHQFPLHPGRETGIDVYGVPQKGLSGARQHFEVVPPAKRGEARHRPEFEFDSLPRHVLGDLVTDHCVAAAGAGRKAAVQNHGRPQFVRPKPVVVTGSRVEDMPGGLGRNGKAAFVDVQNGLTAAEDAQLAHGDSDQCNPARRRVPR